MPLPIPTMPWVDVSMDFILYLPKTQCNRHSIFEVVNWFSKMIHFIAYNNTNDATHIQSYIFKKWWGHMVSLDLLSLIEILSSLVISKLLYGRKWVLKWSTIPLVIHKLWIYWAYYPSRRHEIYYCMYLKVLIKPLVHNFSCSTLQVIHGDDLDLITRLTIKLI